MLPAMALSDLIRAPIRRSRVVGLAGLFVVWLALLALPAGAQTPWADALSGDAESTAEDAQLTVDELRGELDVIDAEIESLRAALQAASEAEAGSETDAQAEPTEASAEESADENYDPAGASRLRLLEKTRSLFSQQVDELKRAEILGQNAADLDALAASGVTSLVDHEPPFGFDDLDSLLARLDSSKARQTLLEDTVAAGVEALDGAESRLRQAQQARTWAREELDGIEAADRAKAEETLEQKRLAARLAEAELAQLRQQLVNDRRELELVEQRQEVLRQGVGWVRGRLQATDEGLAARLGALAAEQERLRSELADLRRQAEREENRLLRAQSAGRAAEAEATRIALDLMDRRQRLLEERIDRRDLQADLWRQRHRLAAEKLDRAKRREIQTAVGRDVAEMERDRRLLQARLQDVRTDETRVSEQLLENSDAAGSTESAAASSALRRQGELLDEQGRFLDAQIDDVETALALARRVESEAAVEGVDAGEIVSGAWQRVVSVWRWQITEVDSRSITLGMVILALLLLIAGYVASKRISHAFGRVLQQRFGLSSGAAAALQSIAFYLMVIAFVLWAMQLVSIPLTVFTLLGGALAIGIGFGSQNVVNNFISGLILLVERPVKVGDLVEVDGTVGSVERIGLRSTRCARSTTPTSSCPTAPFSSRRC